MSNLAKPEDTGAVLGVVCCLFGILAVVMSFDARKTNWLAQQQEQAVTIDPNLIDPKNEGKLIHTIGEISPNPQEYHDPTIDIRGRGFAMVRQTLEYGYAGGDGGGGDGWYPLREPSVFGDDPEAAVDRFHTAVWMPKNVRIGAFALDDTIVLHWLRKKIPATANIPTPVKVTDSDKIRIHLEKASWDAATFKELTFAKDNGGKPSYGDRRILYRLVKINTEPVTLLCRQSGNRLEPATIVIGGPFFHLHLGKIDRTEAFTEAHQYVRRESWIVLIVGLAIVSVGIKLIVWTVRRLRRWHAQQAQSMAAPSPTVSPSPGAPPV